MFTQCFFVIHHIVPYDNTADITSIIACSKFLTTNGCRDRVEEVGCCALCAIERQRQVVRQLRHEGNCCFSCSQQTIVCRFVVLCSGNILSRRSDIYAIEVVVKLIWILWIPYRSVSRRIDDSRNYTATVRTRTRNNTCTLVGIVRIGYACIKAQPLTNVVFNRCAEIVTLVT